MSGFLEKLDGTLSKRSKPEYREAHKLQEQEDKEEQAKERQRATVLKSKEDRELLKAARKRK